ncbi:MAG: Stf0 family sulfotransferase [Dongiaceae bacterium]
MDRPATTATRRYLILGESLFGGSLLAEALRLSGQAGVPLEYFSRRRIDAYAARIGVEPASLTMNEYVSYLVRYRTTDNGVFVLKALPSQMKPFLLLKEPVATFLRGFDRTLLMYRRDKLAQAVSYYKAVSSDVWNSGDRLRRRTDVKTSALYPAHLSQTLRLLFREERDLLA